MVNTKYIPQDVRQYYEQIKRIYPSGKSRNCEGTLDIVGNLLSQAKLDQLQNSNRANYVKVEAFKILLEDHLAAWNFGACDRKKAEAQVKMLNDIIEKETKFYEEEINQQTNQQNKVVLFVSLSAFVIGIYLIIKK